MQWTEKYRPERFEELRGQDEAIGKAKKFIEDFYLSGLTKRRKNALLLHGSPGTGKTTFAYVIANETNSEIFELNASDLRNREKLQSALRPAVEQQSLDKKRKVILIDEVDGISGYYDRGGILEILSLLATTPYPMIITANDAWGKKLSALRPRCELVKLKQIDYRTIKDVLIKILRNEGMFLDQDVLTEISTKSRGDLRAAINDLQREAHTKAHEAGTKRAIDERDREKDIFNVLREIFKGKPSKESLELINSLNMSMDEALLWIEKNIPAEYKGKELARAFDLLSRADIFKGRIYKQQYWRFLLYENFFLSYGISASKGLSKISQGFTSYRKPDRVLNIWLNNKRTEKRKSIAEKYARKTHIGKKRSERDFPVFVKFLKNPKIQEELRLDDEEIEYIDGFN